MMQPGWYKCNRQDEDRKWSTFIFLDGDPTSGRNTFHRVCETPRAFIVCAETIQEGEYVIKESSRFHKEVKDQLEGKDVDNKYFLMVPLAFSHEQRNS